MFFSDILSQNNIKNLLTESADKGRIPHAQLFIGKSGYGVLPVALAFSQYILCRNTDGENRGGEDRCNIQCNQFNHPDLHFVFPVVKSDKQKHPVSKLFLKEWREFLTLYPYGDVNDWYAHLNITKKQGVIYKDEATEIVKSLSLKPFEGGRKVMIIWMAEKMNIDCSNKLLKFIEEPPEETYVILVTEDENKILPTIKSRCQITRFAPLNNEIIKNSLVQNYKIDALKAEQISNQSEGSFKIALQLIGEDNNELQFEQWFIKWVRTAFKAKGNKTSIIDLMSWSDMISKTGRETQKQFLNYCLLFFRQALLANYNIDSLVYMKVNDSSFKLDKFSKFIHSGNILNIAEEIEKAIYHIERNGNSKIILSDLSINLTRLIHQSA